MDIAEIFGKRIASLRKERGMNIEELSKTIHLSQRTIIMLESGQRNPTVPEVSLGSSLMYPLTSSLGKATKE